MRVIGLAGWSGAGKTHLLRRLVPELVRRGLTVSTLKHAHHAFEIDRPGKDSFEHRQAGASEVLELHGTLAAPVARVGSRNCPVPFSKPLEEAYMYSDDRIESAMGMGLDRLLMAVTGLGIRDTVLFPLVKPE